MAKRIIVEALCTTATTGDYNYYEKGRTYQLDLEWAEKKDILRHFEVSREVPQKEHEEEVRDGMIIRKTKAEERAEAKAEKAREAEAANS